MKAFTINAEGNITAFASREAADANLPPTGAVVFSSAAGLQSYLKQFPAAAAVEIWNSITGVKPVTKFTSRETAVKRIWAAIQSLEPIAPQTAHLAQEEAPAKKRASRAKKAPTRATKAAKPAGSGPRESSKTAQLVEMLRRAGGATLEDICKKFGWLPHTTRAMLSAGGSLAKKHGLTVISEKVGSERRYSIKA